MGVLAAYHRNRGDGQLSEVGAVMRPGCALVLRVGEYSDQQTSQNKPIAA